MYSDVVFGVVRLYSIRGGHKCFRVAYCLHLQTLTEQHNDALKLYSNVPRKVTTQEHGGSQSHHSDFYCNEGSMFF
jgi:hypothetical protein